jgi:hypothetical protein
MKNAIIPALLLFLITVSFNLQAAPVAPADDNTSILTGLGTFLTAFNLSFLANQRYEFETGLVYAGYNDVRIPGSSGTLFSLTDDLKDEQSYHFRFRLIQPIAQKHRLIFTYAPMKLKSRGKLDNSPIPGDLYFGDLMVPADLLSSMEFEGIYRLDSYRQTYLYDVMKLSNSQISLGLSAEIRDEAITLKSGDYSGKRSDNNLIILGTFSVSGQITQKINFLVEGDILFDSKNRAEDVYFGTYWKILKDSKFKIGYRIIERSTDKDDIYNRAMFHFLTVGVDLNP